MGDGSAGFGAAGILDWSRPAGRFAYSIHAPLWDAERAVL